MSLLALIPPALLIAYFVVYASEYFHRLLGEVAHAILAQTGSYTKTLALLLLGTAILVLLIWLFSLGDPSHLRVLLALGLWIGGSLDVGLLALVLEQCWTKRKALLEMLAIAASSALMLLVALLYGFI